MSTAILIGETVKKDVVYSAECFDQKPMDSNTQLIVEYSVMALESKYMIPVDNREIINNIDAALDIINGSLKIASAIYPPAGAVLLPLANVGKGIQMIMEVFKDKKPDLLTPKLQELEKAFVMLEEKMEAHFTDMQLFMSEHHFDVNITIQVGTLMRYMRNCIKNQEKDDVENFKDEYENNCPLSLTYMSDRKLIVPILIIARLKMFLASLLENHASNPLLVAMDLETAKTRATFNKWKTIITGILGEYLFIETFASGLLGKSTTKQDRIIQQWNDLLKSFDEWEEHYKAHQGYWTELQRDFVRYFEVNTHLNNAQKSLAIKERLDTILTSDSFYICVFNETDWEKDYAYYCFKESEQIIGAWRKGRCNAFVYRSRKGSSLDKDAYSLGKDWYNQCLSTIRGGGSLKNVIKERLVDTNMMNGCFYAMFAQKCEVQINYLNQIPEDSQGRKNLGPGHTGEFWINHTSGVKGEFAYFTHILAFE